MTETQLDEDFMAEALAEAERAFSEGEVPVGAVTVLEGQVIGRGRNRREALKDPTAHAEILALREASRALGGWRLSGATLYSTMEPCPMCAGALIQARADRLVYAVRDPKSGAAGSLYDIARDPRFNHRLRVDSGVLAVEAETLLKRFFAGLREVAPAGTAG